MSSDIPTQTILILGGTGLAGSTLARSLVEQTSAHIIIAGRNLERAQAAADKLNAISASTQSEQVSARLANAADTDSLQQAFKGVNLVVVAASTIDYIGDVATAALDAGADFYDIMMATPAKWEAIEALKPRILEENRCFITEGGIFPGMPSTLARALSPRFKHLDSANCYGLMLEDWKSFSFSGPTMDEMAHALKGARMEALQDGVWGKVSMSQARKKHDFGGIYGPYSCSVQYYEEIRRLKDIYPSLQEAGVYSYGTNWFCENLFFPLAFIGMKIAPNFMMKHFGRMFEWAVQTFQKPPYVTVIDLVATGTDLEDRPLKQTLSVSHEDGYVITGACNLAIVKQWINGSIRKPGLHLQGLVTDPEFMLEEIRRAGAEVKFT